MEAPFEAKEDPGARRPEAAVPGVGVGRPPVVAPAPLGVPKGPFLPISTGAVASASRPRVPKAERRFALRLSVIEGSLAAVHTALTGNNVGGNVFTVGFALLLGAKDPELGLLTAIPQLATAGQALAAYLARRAGARRPIVVAATLISRLSFAIWPLLPLLSARSALHCFLALWAIASVGTAAANNAWMSWMADLVPRAVRGRYFSLRNNVNNLVGLGVSVGAGLALDAYAAAAPGADAAADARRLAGFTVLFAMAVLAGGISSLLLARQPEPSRGAASSPDVPLDAFLAGPIRDPNFRRLVLFYAYFWACHGLAQPFWTPFVLEDLGQSYAFVTAMGLLGGVAGILTLPLWGRFADRFGSRPALAIAAAVTITHPFYYLIARPDLVAPIYLDAVSSGIVWGGFNLALFNIVLSTAPRGPGREIYYAVFNAAGGLALAATSTLSGLLVASLPHVSALGLALGPRQVIFASVSALRLLALPLLFLVRERGPRGGTG